VKDGAAEVRWAPRVPKSKVRRLYESDARGLLDEDLLEDVGSAVAARCRSILDVSEARHGRIRCPKCVAAGRETIIAWKGNEGAAGVIRCPVCSWESTWMAYRKTFRRKQLHEGAAGRAFREYLAAWDKAKTRAAKMLSVDRVIHEFHAYLFRNVKTGEERVKPSRAACVNLIEGRLTDVVAFLDALAAGDTAGGKARETWRSAVSENREAWKDWRIAGKAP